VQFAKIRKQILQKLQKNSKKFANNLQKFNGMCNLQKFAIVQRDV